MVPALALPRRDAGVGAAERVIETFTERLSERFIAYEATKQKDKPAAQARLGEARVRLRALHGLFAAHHRADRRDFGGREIGSRRAVRADARLAAAHIVKESRGVIAGLLEASGRQRTLPEQPAATGQKRDVDVLSGHVVFDYDVSRELAGALAIGVKVSPIAMV